MSACAPKNQKYEMEKETQPLTAHEQMVHDAILNKVQGRVEVLVGLPRTRELYHECVELTGWLANKRAIDKYIRGQSNNEDAAQRLDVRVVKMKCEQSSYMLIVNWHSYDCNWKCFLTKEEQEDEENGLC